jgi:hypothetical protein
MDFGKMKDQLKDQMSDKVKDELMEKVDEVKADVEKKFGNFGATTQATSEQSTGSSQLENLNASRSQSGNRPEAEANIEDSTTPNEEEAQEPATVAETDLNQDSDDEKEVA